MNRAASLAALMVLATLAGAWLRLADLGVRPMHHDEAVQAIKLGALLEGRGYVYDPAEYHGPALNYLSLPVVRLSGARTLAAASEADLRLLPALCGVALVAMVWLLREGLGRTGTLCAAALTAVSPALVYYGRDYIAETPLVLFSFGAIVCGWRYLRGTSKRRAGWLVAAGVCVGMMHASKETFVIALFAMGVAAAVTLVWSGREARAEAVRRLPTPGLAAGAVLLPAVLVSVLFFSSFLGNLHGVLDSFATYASYLGRAAGRQDAAWHLHPWWYYAGVLLWPGGPFWTQAPALALAAVGFAAGAARRVPSGADAGLVRFLGIYALVMLAVYSALPYKTPWCLLGALQAMLLPAGVGAAVLLGAARGRAGRALVAGLLLLVLGFTAYQAWLASFSDCADPANPYAYAQTTPDVPALARRLEELTGGRLPVQVICPGNDYWPLPWYLRGFGRTGWLTHVPDGPLAPVLIVKPEVEPALADRLFAAGGRLYVALPGPGGGDWSLRPNVPLRVYVRLDVWEARAP